MTIINLTSHERWKLTAGYKHGWTMDFYSPADRNTLDHLENLGVVERLRPNGHTAALTPTGRAALDYLATKKDEETALWKATEEAVRRIKTSKEEYSGTSLFLAEYTHHDDGTIEATRRYSSGNADGSSTVYRITITRTPEDRLITQINEEIDHHDAFWGPGGPRDQDNPARRAVIDGKHYLIAPETTHPHDFRGHGGRTFIIEFFDGRTVTTTNLWSQGRIPPKWREKFPDNARFQPQPPRPSLAEQLGLTPKP